MNNITSLEMIEEDDTLELYHAIEDSDFDTANSLLAPEGIADACCNNNSKKPSLFNLAIQNGEFEILELYWNKLSVENKEKVLAEFDHNTLTLASERAHEEVLRFIFGLFFEQYKSITPILTKIGSNNYESFRIAWNMGHYSTCTLLMNYAYTSNMLGDMFKAAIQDNSGLVSPDKQVELINEQDKWVNIINTIYSGSKRQRH